MLARRSVAADSGEHAEAHDPVDEPGLRDRSAGIGSLPYYSSTVVVQSRAVIGLDFVWI